MAPPFLLKKVSGHASHASIAAVTKGQIDQGPRERRRIFASGAKAARGSALSLGENPRRRARLMVSADSL